MSCCPKQDDKQKCAPQVHEHVQEFYSTKMDSHELGSTAPELCCPLVCKLPVPLKAVEALKLVHPDCINASFGCGLPYPSAVDGCRVLDLGSGAGKDAFVLAYMAGQNGHVTGVDMTPKMLERSRMMVDFHTEKFGFSNVDFKEGNLEKLNEIDGLQNGTFDIIVSNCVINLCTDKSEVFRQAFQLLKPGGELYFSDIYCDSPLPKHILNDVTAWNECFAGALPWSEFVATCKGIGYSGPFVLDSTDYKALEPSLAKTINDIQFWSKTVRLFKPIGSDAAANRSVTYLGTIDNQNEFILSETCIFKKDEPKELASPLAITLEGSHYAKHFTFQ